MSEIEKAIEQLDMQIKCTVNTVSIASCQLAIEALGKQIPYKPTSNVKFGIGKCKCGVEFLDKDTAYCGNCGQKLDWEGKE